MQKAEKKRILRLKGKKNLVKHMLAERTETGKLNIHREQQKKEGVKCICSKPKERGHYLKYKKFDSESLVGLIPKGLRGPPGL